MDPDWDERDVSDANPIPPLSDFLLVEYLKLGMIYAFGQQTPSPDQRDTVERFEKDCIENLQNIVAPNISILSLTCCDVEQRSYPLMDIVLGFARYIDASHPRLRTIIIEVCTYGWDDAVRANLSSLPVLYEFEPVKDYCSRKGILLEKEVVHFDDDFSVLWGLERVARSDLYDGMLT